MQFKLPVTEKLAHENSKFKLSAIIKCSFANDFQIK